MSALAPLVDAHCHVDLYPDPVRIVEETERAGICTVAVTNAPSVFERSSRLTEGRTFLRTALGLHPELASQRARELPLLMDLLPRTRFVGEVGLDYVTRDEGDRDIQRQVFGAILRSCADLGDRVLTVHSRRAADAVLDMIGASYPGKVILHWFSGSRRALDRAVAQGCYFSINPAMFESAAGRALVAAIPRERALTESDGPFAAAGGQSALPHDVERAVTGLSSLWAVEAGVVRQTVYRNFRSVLSRRQSGQA